MDILKINIQRRINCLFIYIYIHYQIFIGFSTLGPVCIPIQIQSMLIFRTGPYLM